MKKPIRLVKENEEMVTNALREAMGRATAHVFHASDIFRLGVQAEKRLSNLGLIKKEMVGAKVCARSGTPTSNAYKRAARSCVCTSVTMERRATGWFIVGIAKTDAYAGSNPEPRYIVPATAIAAGSKRLLADVTVI
jgi:hypothetical protein